MTDNIAIVRLEFETSVPEVLTGLLSAFPVIGFEERDAIVLAYFEHIHWKEYAETIRDITKDVSRLVRHEIVADQNWNAVWEASFAPVIIGTFCAIRASFHPAIQNCRHEIIIDPKMAFGTGHHETTALMIRMMEEIGFSGARVLDLGCGTGVLAILAAKMGARLPMAIDNDALAVSSAQENALQNNVKIICHQGTIGDVTASYDIILANIDRNTLLDAMENMSRHLTQKGVVLLSGILPDDSTVIEQEANRQRLNVVKTLQNGEWIAMRLEFIQGVRSTYA